MSSFDSVKDSSVSGFESEKGPKSSSVLSPSRQKTRISKLMNATAKMKISSNQDLNDNDDDATEGLNSPLIKSDPLKKD